MKYRIVKEVLKDLFAIEKLQMLQEEWGFFNETGREIRTVGYATNLTPQIIRKAGEANVDFLLTHHDSWGFIYGLKEECNQTLIDTGITHAFFHAPLDDAEFGTSASLAEALNIKHRKKAMPYKEVYYGGVIGEISPVSFAVFKEKLSCVLNEEIRYFQNHDREIQKVAVAAGGGNMTSEMRIAAEQGCDTYVTGEYVLYSQQYAEHAGMNLFVGSHTNTEILGVEALAERLCGNTDMKKVRIQEPNY